MKDIKWVFVFYSIAAVLSMCAIGVAVAIRSIPLAILAMVAVVLIMGYGFKTKKKLREQGAL